MITLRRSPRSSSPRAEVCLRGVVPLDPSALGEDVSGRVQAAPDSLVPSALHDIEVQDQGLLIAPSTGAGSEIPSLPAPVDGAMSNPWSWTSMSCRADGTRLSGAAWTLPDTSSPSADGSSGTTPRRQTSARGDELRGERRRVLMGRQRSRRTRTAFAPRPITRLPPAV